MEIDKNKYELITNLVNKKKVDPNDVVKMEGIIKNHIDKHMVICRHCPAQIRMAHRRLKNWYEKTEFNVESDAEVFDFNKIELELVNNMNYNELVAYAKNMGLTYSKRPKKENLLWDIKNAKTNTSETSES